MQLTGAQALIKSLLGTAAINNSKMAYQEFLQVFNSDRFARLKKHGARVQRPLWASTSTKNPEYNDVMYVDDLIGPDTVAPGQRIDQLLRVLIRITTGKFKRLRNPSERFR